MRCMTDMLKQVMFEKVISTVENNNEKQKQNKFRNSIFNKSTVTVNTMAMLMLQQSQHPQALRSRTFLGYCFCDF